MSSATAFACSLQLLESNLVKRVFRSLCNTNLSLVILTRLLGKLPSELADTCKVFAVYINSIENGSSGIRAAISSCGCELGIF